MPLAHFRGGPLAGQTVAVERVEHTYRVPVFPPSRPLASALPAPVEMPELEVEEYRISRGGSADFDYDVLYDWVNPAAALRERVRQLDDVVQRQQEQMSQNAGLIAELKKDSAKWHSVRSAIGIIAEQAREGGYW